MKSESMDRLSKSGEMILMSPNSMSPHSKSAVQCSLLPQAPYFGLI